MSPCDMPTAATPLSPRFVRQSLNDGEPALFDLLQAGSLDEQLVARSQGDRGCFREYATRGTRASLPLASRSRRTSSGKRTFRAMWRCASGRRIDQRMATAFDASAIERHGWRQGAVLGPALAAEARKLAPQGISFTDSDWLIVTSHDCDIVNGRLEKEPFVEVLRATVVQQKKPDNQQVWGRNPREMQFAVDDANGGTVVLSTKVHERWSVPRELLVSEAPRCVLDDKRRVIAEWLAKRYIRAAFPTAFDARWRWKMKDWTGLLESQSQWMQGVYLRLSTLSELDDDSPSHHRGTRIGHEGCRVAQEEARARIPRRGVLGAVRPGHPVRRRRGTRDERAHARRHREAPALRRGLGQFC
jgi:hypothetical protein